MNKNLLSYACLKKINVDMYLYPACLRRTIQLLNFQANVLKQFKIISRECRSGIIMCWSASAQI